jgi:hypothetical protein
MTTPMNNTLNIYSIAAMKLCIDVEVEVEAIGAQHSR